MSQWHLWWTTCTNYAPAVRGEGTPLVSLNHLSKLHTSCQGVSSFGLHLDGIWTPSGRNGPLTNIRKDMIPVTRFQYHSQLTTCSPIPKRADSIFGPKSCAMFWNKWKICFPIFAIYIFWVMVDFLLKIYRKIDKFWVKKCTFRIFHVNMTIYEILSFFCRKIFYPYVWLRPLTL